MSVDVAAIVERARLAARQPASPQDAPGADREQLTRIAAEFESMLLVQVLKDMRRAGSWDEEGGADSLGAESLFETLDVELASHLARVRGLGLGTQLEEAFDRLNGAPGARLAASMAQLPSAPSQLTNPDLAIDDAQRSIPGNPAARLPVGRPGAGSGEAGAAGPTRQAPDVVSVVKAVADKAADAPAAVGQILKPVAGAVTSAFGWRRHPLTHEVKFHQGVDLRAAYGQEVQAAAAGKVVFSGDQGGYGATVVVEHADGTRTRYAHLSARLVKPGDAVEAGEPLGRAGKSGRATGTHLHFEVIAPNGQRIAPERWAGGRHAPLSGPAEAGHVAETVGTPAAREVRPQADPLGPADAGLRVGNPPVMTVARSIQDRAGSAD